MINIRVYGLFQILCSPQPNRFYWEYVDFTKPHDGQMREAVKGGYQSNLDVSDTYIGKVMHENEWKIGKVVEIGHPTVAGIWVWNNVNLKTFHLLKYNLTSPECNKRPTLVCGLCG